MTNIARISPASAAAGAPAHVVAVVAFDGVVPFDLAIPCEVFERVRLRDGRAPYVVRVCGTAREVAAQAFTIRPRAGLATLRDADTVVVPGIDDVARPIPPTLVSALRRAAARGARIVSICSGAFVLAATGLLDGRRATTHWLATDLLARRHPEIRVEPDALFVDEGALLTSAGAAAGLDLCLHLVRRDFGAEVAAHAARCAVMPLTREGGQAQFIRQPDEHVGHEVSLAPLLRWMTQHLREPLSLAQLARRAGMSTRTLSRHFREQVGTSPTQWLLRARVRRAQQLLERTKHAMSRVADDCGFGSIAAFRAHFQRVVGTSPRSYRAAFGGGRRS